MDKKNQKERWVKKRKRGEETLRAGDARHQAILEWAHDAIVSVDCEGRIIEFNKVAETMFGYAREAVIGQEMAPLIIPPALRERYSVGWERYLATGATAIICKRVEITTMRADGTEFPVELTVTRLGPEEDLTVTAIIRDITERKLAEEALRAAEGELRALFGAMTEVVLVLDSDGRYLKIAPTNPGLLYKPPDELINRTIHEVLPPAHADNILCHIRRALATRKSLNVEYTLPLGGKDVWFHGTVSPLTENTVFWVARDITERKRMEEALRESEKRFRSLYDDNPSMYFTVDAAGTVLSGNRFGMEQLGYHTDELMGRSVWAVFHEEDRQKARACLRVAFQSPAQVHQWELRKVRKDGGVLWVREDVRIVQDTTGKPLALVVCEDITERKRAEELLRESQRVSSTLISNLPGMVYRCRNDQDRALTYLSEGCFALTGYHPIDFTENRVTYVQLIHPDDQDIVWDGAQAALRAKKPFTFSYRIKTASGEEKWVWEQGRGIFACDGELLFREGFITDITKHMQVEAALQESERRATMLSHRLLEIQEAERRHVSRELHDEIGQCLTGLKLGLETALRLREREARRVLLQLVEQADSLISKSRELSLDLRPAMLDDMGLLPALFFHFERFRERFGLQVKFKHRGIEGRFHLCLETAVFRIVQEALTNVVRHARVEEATVTIIADEDGLNVHVGDEGVGFDPGKAIASGKAVGLSGIHERAFLLGGHCDIESVPGTGTQIRIQFLFSEVAKREAMSRVR